MKKIISFLLVTIMMFSLAACGGNDSQGEGNTSADSNSAEGSGKDYEVVVVPKDASNPWFVRMESGVKEYADETGLNVYQKGTDEIDATKQAQLVQDLIAQGVDAICVVPVDPESIEPVLKQAKEAGIVVITHEGAALENVDYDIEAFSNSGYGAFIMDNLAEAMGEEGVYTTMVASVTNASHNEWADAAVEHQKANYPNMTLLKEEPRVESNDNGDTAYNVAKELFKKYPDLKGIMGTSSFDSPGIARAIEELGLVDKAFTSGTGMPADNAELLKSGVVKSLTLWDPAQAGKAMISLAVKVLDSEEVAAPLDLGIEGYDKMQFREGSDTVLEGEGWIIIDAKNVESFGF
ncbi:autoinducer 2 ABC transporter substrate-binding protein [Faecalicatena contorta]|uniref:Monosaccharide ABC transporter substrate-binding protein, CUT2 family n=1 Tax=Faecalicatena contorta TaxID=39482 RepID=A0A315ZTR9_9FIRM|nr:autoinducer 2 ABC transporter substrate-binding protein [Faecalicatena contorta]PWJ48951.1 monosaccharide ABC transporter substrate-binding protein (CUT2 family) [Faecalicatena contorta]SUQ15041.1 monosaccharide ABC transporter substrate-binding protein, CUT2 family [Faecalicatena contorta]